MGCCLQRRRADEPSAAFWEAEILASPAPPAPGSAVEWPPATTAGVIEQELADADQATEVAYEQLTIAFERARGRYLLALRASWSGDAASDSDSP